MRRMAVVVKGSACSDNPNSNPPEAYIFSVKFVFQNKQKKKSVLAHLTKVMRRTLSCFSDKTEI